MYFDDLDDTAVCPTDTETNDFKNTSIMCEFRLAQKTDDGQEETGLFRPDSFSANLQANFPFCAIFYGSVSIDMLYSLWEQSLSLFLSESKK